VPDILTINASQADADAELNKITAVLSLPDKGFGREGLCQNQTEDPPSLFAKATSRRSNF
jgi:hypothetical protein